MLPPLNTPIPHTGGPDLAEIERGGKRVHLTATETVEYRWEPYKPDGQRQMKAKGRWQRMEVNGDFHRWQNCDRPIIARAPADRIEELEAALKLIDALDPENMISGCSADAARGLVSRMGEIARTALKGATE